MNKQIAPNENQSSVRNLARRPFAPTAVEPQNHEQGMPNDKVPQVNHGLFSVRHSLFDIRNSKLAAQQLVAVRFGSLSQRFGHLIRTATACGSSRLPFHLIAFCFLLVTPLKSAANQPPQTNFVFFLVDDLGWADVGCFGSSFYETPHIDALAASGMRFTNGYAACPVCSPTRASIMTGRHPVRVDITDWIPGAPTSRHPDAKFQHVHDRDNLALDEVTIAEALKEHNYQTFFAGKWHLGGRGHWPTDQGFDINIGGCEKGSPPGGYYAPWKNPNLKSRTPDEYLTERLTDESVAFLEKRSADQPFLLFLSYYNVHTPITPYKKRIEHFRHKSQTSFLDDTPFVAEHTGFSRARQDNAAMASMIAAVDESVGRILATIDALHLTDRTVVVFFADNGGLCTLGNKRGPTSNLPLRSGKGWLYEGGIREPTIIRAPGVAKPGTVCDTPIVSMDFFPTLLELAGLSLMPDRHKDGTSLVPLLKGQRIADRLLFWHYPHYHGSTWKPGASIRDGDWKLIEFYHWDTFELYNLADDPGERRDLRADNPQQAMELREKLQAWQKRMKARMPVPVEQPS